MSDTYSPIPELNLLKKFEDSLDGEFFAPGFELFDYNEDVDWFRDETPDTHRERLIPFAQATSSGSFYALWRCDDRTDLATLPVILFGDEGELYIAADNLRELFQELATEPDESRGRVDEPARQKFLVWLRQNFGITPEDTVESANGDGDLDERFAAWIAEFASPDLLDHVLSELGVYSPIPELNLLKEFQDSLNEEEFAPGFELIDYNDEDLSWDAVPDAYRERLVPFAYASASGAFYALWRCDDRTDLATLPIILFGAEGELRVEARDLRDLFRRLAVEPDDPEDLTNVTSARQKYLVWLRQNFGITPQDTVDDSDGVSVDGYARRFAVWVSEFASADVLEQVLSELGVDMP